jgi:hypothetical protein
MNLQPVDSGNLSSSLLRFAHKTPKRLSADFLLYKLRSYQRYAQPDNRGFFAASSATGCQCPDTNETAGFLPERTCSKHETAQGIEAVSFCPVTGWRAKDTSVKPGFLRRFQIGAAKNAPNFIK